MPEPATNGYKLQLNFSMIVTLLTEPSVELFRVDYIPPSDADGRNLLGPCESIKGVLTDADSSGGLFDRIC